ncbi:ester cyclase [Amycolatopsis sp. WQ 127309]|uniref:ester cyclase n=1 Tax=Amycolatopsis sp. WQ 127309 TaxID=2932773 RepID=UPI001FF2B229|nr:ester cyclase [Amycolatopsis sp. WQ 127309]UOZ03573.1 ester cyclase [Amycolatopsis sp. WQ 127309]
MTRPSSPAEVNRAILAARAAGDLDTALSYIAPESRDQGHRVTHADWRRKWESLLAGVPDFDVVVEADVENGEWVAHRYTVRGTHTGDFFGRPPTGDRFEVAGMDMIRVVDGRLVEHWMVAEPF